MNLVDVIIFFAAIGALRHGWRIGIIRGVSGFAGLLVGGFAALQALPIAIDSFAPDTFWRIASSIGLVTTGAVVGEALGSIVGAAIRRTLTWTPVQFLDSLLGSAFRIVSFTIVVWLLTSGMALLPDRGVVHLVRTSEIVSVLDQYAPDVANEATSALRRALRSTNFPVVFAGIAPQPQQSVQAPDPKVLEDPRVRADYPSIVQVVSDAASCSERMDGTGFVFARDRVMTNAHVVAGANIVHVVVGGTRRLAKVVLFDPHLDVAVLSVPGIGVDALRLSDDTSVGMDAVVPGFTGGRPLSPDAARIADRVIARGHDIYGVSSVDREVLVLRAAVAPGDSGSPLLGVDGRVLGLVFAAGTEAKDVGYALTVRAISQAVAAGVNLSAPVSTGQCVA